MADLKSILSDPNYINASPETKRAIFEKWSPQDPAYSSANPETQAAIRNRFGVVDDAPVETAAVQESGDTDPNAEGLQWEAVLRDKRDPQRAAERRQDPDFSDKMLGSMPGRIALGVATPVYGAGQFGANVGDWLSEKMGNEPVVGDWLNQNWDRVQDMKYRGMTTPEERAAGEQPWDVAGGLANVATAFASAPKVAGGALSKLGQMLGGTSKVGAKIIPRVAQGATTGAVYGGAQPGMDLEEQGEGAAWGVGLGGGASGLLGPAAKGLGWLTDLWNGNSAKVSAGKIGRAAMDESGWIIPQTLDAARPGINAGQAVQEWTNSPTWQALQKLADSYRSGAAERLANAQKIGRRDAINNVTPNLGQAEATRAGNAKINYGLADAVGNANIAKVNRSVAAGVLSPDALSTAQTLRALEELRGNPVIRTAARDVGKSTADDPFGSMKMLHEMKLALDDTLSKKSTQTELSGLREGHVKDARQLLLDRVDDISPLYAGAKRGFAKDSVPVNQSTVLTAIQKKLAGNRGREEVGSLLNVLGSGETALLKDATGRARFEEGDLKKILSDPQYNAVDNARREVLRDAEMERLASAGSKQLHGIVANNSGLPRLPGFFSPKITMANVVIGELEGKIAKSTMEVLAEGMQSGKGMMEIIDLLPAVERGPILKVLNSPELALKIARASNAGVAAGAD